MLAELARDPDPRVEFLDGGTQGRALAGHLGGRRALVVLDAVRLGAAPGTVHVLRDPLGAAPPRGGSAHESNVGDLLAAACLLGELPQAVVLVGIEPALVQTGLGLSAKVAAAVPAAARAAQAELARLCAGVPEEGAPCTS